MRLSHAFGGVAALVAVWQLGVMALAPPHYILPSPVETTQAFLHQPGFLMRHGFVTLSEILVGLALGSLFGVATAFAIAAFPRAGRLVWPMVVVLQALPVFVLAPLLVLWFGFGMASKVAMTTIIIFFPVASAFGDGLRRTNSDILDAVSLTQASHWQALVRVRAPLALPSLISGLRVAAPLAPLGAVVGEWVGASAGLGFVMVQANARMQTDTVFAAMAILAVFAVVLRLMVDRLTASLVPWAREAEPACFPKSSRRSI
ncbi:putative hydroxymethylpyrimidine transport system permease protein [Pararhizobium capsulatum DSM 1112]|uniref:Hydroxymethylpyrimidine transport system permease protein n=1 Tax=Pararhizobium capsulatum DSM 1112 TaxID=1121113 RepID=A0ABU0BS34_9HYPH|nr:ABC transporter permease [Pararhizobium capsulatum]MDQ0321072.1 putative hydroxymethylpyrimidine transport system permease protein [Pararhizobium capsulatum DSM 1112]